MIKALCLAIGLTVVLGVTDVTTASDGNLSQSMLEDLGLSSMQIMPDAQGEQIRGKGFTSTFSFSWANGATSGPDTSLPVASSFVSNAGASAGGFAFAVAW